MKKNLSLILILSLTLTLGAFSLAEDTREMEGNMYLTGLPIVKEPITIRMVGYQHDNVHTDLNDLAIVKKWEADTNINFEIEVVTRADATERVNLMIATQNLPDAFFGGYGTCPDIAVNGAEGTFIALEDLIEQYAPTICELFEKYPYLKTGATYPDGHIYGFPAFSDNGQGTNYGMFIYKEQLAATGLEMPKTTDEFLALLRALKGIDFNGDGIANDYPLSYDVSEGGNSYGNFFLWFGMPQFAMEYIAEDGAIQCPYTTEGFREGAKFLNTIYTEGLCDPEVFTHDAQAYRAKVREGNYAIFTMWAPYNAFGVDMTLEDIGLDIMPAPVGPQGTTGWVWQVVNPATDSFVITSACEHPEILVRFADYLAELDNSMAMGWGVIGQNLIKNDDGTYYQNPVQEDTQNFGGAGFFITPRDRYELIIGSDEYTNQRVARRDMYIDIVDLESRFPYVLASAEESEELSVLTTDLTSYINQKLAQWVTVGGADEEWDAFLAQLDAMGLKDYLAIKQQQYDRYLASK